MKEIKAFRCDFCKEIIMRKNTMRKHEVLCKMRHKSAVKERNRYNAQKAEDEQNAMVAAKEDKALRVVVEAGFVEVARQRAAVILEDTVFNDYEDYECSSWYEDMYKRMVLAVADIVGVDINFD